MMLGRFLVADCAAISSESRGLTISTAAISGGASVIGAAAERGSR
jgi:hypothetical protein